ncbi:hypothetical protein TNCV_2947101 [Trichonephila clavipes]|nr:hypothetical protein TNCV_2947101 [Trichonephila clavipes]
MIENDNNLLHSEFDCRDIHDNEENIVNICRVMKKSEITLKLWRKDRKNEQHVTIVWKEIQIRGTPERSLLHNIFSQEVGQAGYAKRHITMGKVRTAFSLIIDHRAMSHIITCIMQEANRVLVDWSVVTDWSLFHEKLAMADQMARKYITKSKSCR